MDQYIDNAKASEILAKLLRAWQVILRITPYRATERRNRLLEATLAYVNDVVSEHYDFRQPRRTTDNIARESYLVAAKDELRKLCWLGKRLIASDLAEGPFVTQEDLRKAFVGSAITAGQFIGANGGGEDVVYLVEERLLTDTVALEA